MQNTIPFVEWKKKLLDAGSTNTSVSEFSGRDIDVNKGYPLWEIKYDTSDLTSSIRDSKSFVHLRFYIEFKREIDVVQTQASRLIDNFTSFNEYTDLDIICNDTTLKTNKRLLASQSEVFKQMLQQPMAEHLNNIITVKDTNSSALTQLISFLCSAKISSTITTKGLIDLTYLADKYLISTLKKECLMKLESYFNTENIVDMLMLSEYCQCFLSMLLLHQIAPYDLGRMPIHQPLPSLKSVICRQRDRNIKIQVYLF